MTHDDIVERAIRWLLGTHRCNTVLKEFQAIPVDEHPDALGWKGTWSVLVECKAHRSDFLRDRKKLARVFPSVCAVGCERWYLTPPDLAWPDEIPPGWGLAEVRPATIRRIVTPPVSKLLKPPIASVYPPIYHGRTNNELALALAALNRASTRGLGEWVSARPRKGPQS